MMRWCYGRGLRVSTFIRNVISKKTKKKMEMLGDVGIMTLNK